MRIAKELGLAEVPVIIVDVDEWKAEYLLVAENVERRGQAELDPVKKGRIAKFLQEYWGVRNGVGRNLTHNAKGTEDIADAIGESIHQTRRLLKLNDLIPEIQALVSSGKLGTTAAADQYAYITPENQRILIEVLGEQLGRHRPVYPLVKCSR